ncbi:MAG: hypothetical protein AABX54_05290 [Nanoarchaeota archaeon]
MEKIELIHDKPSRFSERKIIAIILLVCAGLIWIPVPIPDKNSIAALLCLILGVYILIKPNR